MDEPFGALDAQTRMVMQHDLQTLVSGSGAAVLFVTHDITEAVMLADRVVVLSRRPTRCIADIAIGLAPPAQRVRAVHGRWVRGGVRPGLASLPRRTHHPHRRMSGTVLAAAHSSAPPATGTVGRRLSHAALRLLPGLLFLLFWQYASGRLVREAYVSHPTAVAARLIDLFVSGEIWPNLLTTGEELALGYGLGADRSACSLATPSAAIPAPPGSSSPISSRFTASPRSPSPRCS